jgi:RecJ-like exonuclease
MPLEQESFEALLKRASEAAALIAKKAEEGCFFNIISHYDADGLAAAGIIGKALFRIEANFRIRIRHWVDEKLIEEILNEKPDLTILTDLGSGYLDLITQKISNNPIVILDHHQIVKGKEQTNLMHVNPHLFGIDGSKDVSGSGVAYLVAKALDKTNVDLAALAVVGALGDLQDKYEQRKLGSVNEAIVEDAVKNGYLKVETDLIFFGRETRPLHKALASTTNPFIPGISGNEDQSVAFLTNLEPSIKLKENEKWRALRDLTEEEKRRLYNALAEYLVSRGLHYKALSLRGHVYTLVKEENWTPLRDGREFAVLLNATGRLDKPSLGVALCMGDRGAAFEESLKILEEYRRNLGQYLSWAYENPERIEERANIYIIHGKTEINDRVIGAIASILSTNLPNPEKPIIAYAFIPEENVAKISARTIDEVVLKGVNLGEIMQAVSEKFEGRGGGHDIAAGAQIPTENLEEFLELTDELVGKHLGKHDVGS